MRLRAQRSPKPQTEHSEDEVDIRVGLKFRIGAAGIGIRRRVGGNGCSGKLEGIRVNVV